MHCLSKNVPEPIDHKSKLISLTPFVDGNGILRVRGRLEHSTLTYDEMHPIILPPNSHFSQLLIDRVHLRTMHGCTGLVTSSLRRQYWIVNARNAIRHRLHKCIVCFRQRPDATEQLMGSLPSARVRCTTRPFLHASKGRGIKAYKGNIAVSPSKRSMSNVSMASQPMHFWLHSVDLYHVEVFQATSIRTTEQISLALQMNWNVNSYNWYVATNRKSPKITPKTTFDGISFRPAHHMSAVYRRPA